MYVFDHKHWYFFSKKMIGIEKVLLRTILKRHFLLGRKEYIISFVQKILDLRSLIEHSPTAYRGKADRERISYKAITL
jgi:hypothetical protein